MIGQRGDEDCQQLLDVIYSSPLDHRVIATIPPGTDLPPNHPASGKTQIDGKATCYVCQGSSCSLPVTSVGALREMLAPPSQ